MDYLGFCLLARSTGRPERDQENLENVWLSHGVDEKKGIRYVPHVMRQGRGKTCHPCEALRN